MSGSSDMPFSLDHLTSDEINRLLAAELAPWTIEDGLVALDHQLDASLLPDLLNVPGTTASRLAAILPHAQPAMTFFDELTCTEPSAELLQLIKDFAKQARRSVESPLSGPPAAVLYYASIAAGLWRLGVNISHLSADDLRIAFVSASKYHGADRLAKIFDGALSKLS